MLSFKSYASGSSGNLYSITDGETTIMIDPGISWKRIQKAFNFKTSEVKCVCLGHEHRDHSFAVEAAAKAGIDIYLLPETRAALGLSGHRFHEIELHRAFRAGSFKVVAFPLQHDVPNCGFLFMGKCGEKAVYITDTFYSRWTFTGLTIIAVECNWSKETLAPGLDPAVKQRLYTSHFSLKSVKQFFRDNDLSKVREIHLLHLSQGNADPEYFRSEIEKLTGKPVYIGGYE